MTSAEDMMGDWKTLEFLESLGGFYLPVGIDGDAMLLKRGLPNYAKSTD